MSRYRPAISIRTDLADPSKVAVVASGVRAYDDVVTRVESYSITPRTLKSVTEFDAAYVSASTGVASASAAGSSYKPELYTSIEEYSYAGNIVLRYAIRADLITTDASGKILGEGSSGARGASMKTSIYAPADAKAAKLHSLEKDIITKAINSFIIPTVAGAKLPSTAIVDIFERNMGKAVNVEADVGSGLIHPIVHSVVLNFTGSEVCVIDPSNFLFSSHLDNTVFAAELAGKPPICTIHKELKIYTPVGDPSYAFNKYRSCDDVAVKIAFGLVTRPITSFTFTDIKTHP